MGTITVTSSASLALTQDDVLIALTRHLSGDWGDVAEQDRRQNDAGLSQGRRLLSRYVSSSGVPFHIVTEQDRSKTVFLLHDELLDYYCF